LEQIAIHSRRVIDEHNPGGFLLILTSLTKNDDWQFSSAGGDKIDGRQNAERPNPDGAAGNREACQIRSTIQRSFARAPAIAAIHPQPNHKHTKIVPKPSIQKYQSLLRQQLGYPAPSKPFDSLFAFDAELAQQSSLALDLGLVKLIMESIVGFENQLQLNRST
jgi:hypothetical protein